MADRATKNHDLHTAETLESPHPGAPVSASHPASDFAHPRIGLLEGSGPNLSEETHTLLRDRLRIASLLLAAGFAAFWIKALISGTTGETVLEKAFFWSHLGVLLMIALIASRLCSNCVHVLKHLRGAELVVFGSSALLLILATYVRANYAIRFGFIPNFSPPWAILIFTYAIFIPNTWRRAAGVIAPLAAMPVLVMTHLSFTSEAFAKLQTTPAFGNSMLETSMVMSLVAVIAIWGIRQMTALRTEVFEAKQLGQYRLRKQIGQGGMGEVYIGEHTLLKRPCAIKLIRPEKAGDPKVLARFEREVQATAQLTHWNTVDIYDFGRAEDGTFYYAMEYLPGRSLQEMIDLYGPLPAGRVIFLLAQTCDALAEAHLAGMIHRDLKPANIFAARRGGRHDVAKLLDFGLVRADSQDDEEDAGLTQEHTLLGSPLYMSPEQVEGAGMDCRSDIYSLGAVAYTMLTGRPPFEGKRALQVILAHARNQPTPPSQWVDTVPADLEAVVLKALAKDPAERFPTADAFRDALLACKDAANWDFAAAERWWRVHECPKKRELEDQICQGQLSKLNDLELGTTVEQAASGTVSS